MEKQYVLVKISKEARKILNILSAEADISSQEYLSNLIKKEIDKSKFIKPTGMKLTSKGLNNN